MHHVTARGIAQADIFLDDADRRAFVRNLAIVLADAGVRCFAWALMSNHYHVVVETGERPLSSAFQRINLRHAQRFNRRYGRSGYVFQNRYDSQLIDSEPYLLEAIRYVHLNPVRAGMLPGVDALDAFPWTSWPELSGAAAVRTVDAAWVLSLFGSTRGRGRTRLREFLAAGFAADPRGESWPPERTVEVPTRLQEDEALGGVRAVAGRQTYLDRVMRSMTSRSATRALLRQRRWTPDRVLRTACVRLGASADDVRLGRKRRSAADARAVAALVLCRHLGMTQAATARELGVSATAVSGCVTRAVPVLRGLGIDPGDARRILGI